VDFVDIDDRTWNISPEKLREKLITAKQEGKLPKIVVVVHLAGEPADLEEIHRLSLEFGFRVIEDASHALGSRYRGEYLGNSRFSDVTVFSFHAVKNISTGEGGMAMTNNPDVAQKLRMLRSHGITRDPKTFLMRNSIPAAWKYEQQMLGYNYRMTDFQAALGMSQLRKLTKFTQRRAAIASLYRQHLRGLENLRFQDLLEDSFSATHLVILRSSPELRSRIHGRLQSQNVGTNLHYYPIHLQPYHYSDARRPLVEAELYGNDAITIPCHPKLSNRQVKRIAGLIRDEASLVPRSNI
jgi:dTDP-4-amino-4,6-dideoxygalactose transaminase